MAPPRTVLATPTVNLSIGDLASCTYRADRCVAIVARPEELAEIGRRPAQEISLRITAQTSSEVLALVKDFWQRLGLTTRVEIESAL